MLHTVTGNVESMEPAENTGQAGNLGSAAHCDRGYGEHGASREQRRGWVASGEGHCILRGGAWSKKIK